MFLGSYIEESITGGSKFNFASNRILYLIMNLLDYDL